jgi:S1-C subfamily serine protease
MATSVDWKVPPEVEPRQEDYAFDLERALSSVVSIRSGVPADAFTADVLGTERSGNGVIIHPDGIVLTIGYLVTEADETWLTLADGRTVAGDVIGFDQDTGFGLVRALARLELPATPSPPASSPARSSPATGSTSSTTPSSPHRRTPSGAAPG